jgi:hypothetical protein
MNAPLTPKTAAIVLDSLQQIPVKERTKIQKDLMVRCAQVIRYAKRRRNPSYIGKPVRIYGRVLRMEAQKIGQHRCDPGCKKSNHSYYHNFSAGAIAWGMPDGSVVLKSATGKRLWGMF